MTLCSPSDSRQGVPAGRPLDPSTRSYQAWSYSTPRCIPRSPRPTLNPQYYSHTFYVLPFLLNDVQPRRCLASPIHVSVEPANSHVLHHDPTFGYTAISTPTFGNEHFW